MNIDSPLKPLGLDVTIEQDNTSTIQQQGTVENQVVQEPNTSMLDTFI